MRYKQLLSEKQLDELRMNPRSLQKFSDSPDAEGIQAGFEAELIFSGLGGASDDYESEPDYDYDERPGSIQGVIDFFSNDDYGNGMSSREANRLQDRLDEAYYEWYDDKLYSEWKDERQEVIRDALLDEKSWTERLHDHLVDEMGYTDSDADAIIKLGSTRKSGNGPAGSEYSEEELDMLTAYSAAEGSADGLLDEEIESCISSEDDIYERAYENFRDNYDVGDDSGFWTDNGWRWMSDIAGDFDLMWPVWTEGSDDANGEYDYGNAEMLAQSLAKTLGVKAHASGGYHSTSRKPGLWILEPDGSLDPDDPENMPVEVVSPPMPLQDCLKTIENFFTWAEDNGAYTNSSTGFHMGVSLPHTGGKVDFIKLALFLGDEHVLREFGRISNHFAEAAMKKIRNKLSASHNKEQIAGALDLMRSNLIELATKQLKIVGQEGFGKYTSINPHIGKDNSYIEFRAAGGANYFEDIDKLKNTLLRYAQAMHVASRPDLERNEYYKKLYKLISPTEGNPSLDLFAKFATGSITKDELKKQWAEVTLSKDAPEMLKKSNWKAYNSEGNPIPGAEYNGYTEEEAWEKLADRLGLSVSNAKGVFTMVDKNKPGNWHLVDDTNQEILDSTEATTRAEAVQIFARRWGDSEQWKNNQVDVVREPDTDEPEEKPKLSRRAELAKRIKQGPKGQQRTPHGVPEWELYDVSTDNVINSIVAHNKDDAWQQADDWLRSIGAEDRSTYKERFAIRPMMVGGTNSERADYEFVYEPTGRILDTVRNITKDEAEKALDGARDIWNDLQPADIFMRRVTPGVRDVGMDVAQNIREPAPRQDFEIYDSSNGNVVHTMRNVTADQVRDILSQYESPSGGYAPGVLRVRDVEQQEPQQVRMPNGVPVWEIYNRNNDSVVHVIADHNRTVAIDQATTWLRSNGVRDLTGYMVRPKMLQPGEQNLSPTISESWLLEWDDLVNEIAKPANRRLV